MYLLLLFLTSVRCCDMVVYIQPESEYTKASVTAYCDDSAPSTDLDLETFGLTPNKVICQLASIGMLPPDFVEVKKASTYGKTDLRTHLRISSAKVVNAERKNLVLFKKYVTNNNSMPVTVNLGVDDRVQERLNIRWLPTNELSVGRSLYINFMGSLFKTSFTKMDRDVWYRSLKTISNYDVTLMPHQNITLTLTVVKARLDVTVEYVSYFTGDIYCEYRLFYIPLAHKTFEVNDYFDLVRSKTVLTTDQLIFLDYYYDAQLVVQDDATGELVLDPIDVPMSSKHS